MYQLRVTLFVVITLVCSGCSTTGGIILNLIPAPKFLKGDITNDIYTAQNKSFSVAVPHKSGSYEYKYMQVKEQSDDSTVYVSFGPAAFDQSIYRSGIVKRVDPSSQSVTLDEFSQKAIELYMQQLSAYGTSPQEVSTRRESINGRRAVYWKLTQLVPAGKFSNVDLTLKHDVYIIDFDKAVALISVQTSEVHKNSIAMEPRAFVESVVVY